MKQKILVVDDEPVLVDTLVYNLQQEGYQVITAADGGSANRRGIKNDLASK